MEGTFHRIELVEPNVSFSSPEGISIFKEALSLGYMDGYFPLAENYTTQSDTTFCGLGSLSMAFNSLLMDPGKVWKGKWRWYDDGMLELCEPLDKIKLRGLTLPKLSCLARCNGANAVAKYASEISLDEFRRDIIRCCKYDEALNVDDSNKSGLLQREVMIASFHRKTLNQTGGGHFSPIGGYHPHWTGASAEGYSGEMVLVMDVARFKYPPYWVPLELLFQAMQKVDSDSGKSRGYLLVASSDELERKCYDCDGVCDTTDSDSVDTSSTNATARIEKHDETRRKRTKHHVEALMEHSCLHCNP